jgi:pimeloyl-ACP methyl ester carboxylesterase
MLVTALVAAGTITLGTASGEAAPASPNITAAPTQIAHTALGSVGYREVGHGPALLMITGFSASMDDWAPYFVDTLAARFRVVVLDNAGVGQTADLAVPLSIPEMAAQTSA